MSKTKSDTMWNNTMGFNDDDYNAVTISDHDMFIASEDAITVSVNDDIDIGLSLGGSEEWYRRKFIDKDKECDALKLAYERNIRELNEQLYSAYKLVASLQEKITNGNKSYPGEKT